MLQKKRHLPVYSNCGLKLLFKSIRNSKTGFLHSKEIVKPSLDVPSSADEQT